MENKMNFKLLKDKVNNVVARFGKQMQRYNAITYLISQLYLACFTASAHLPKS